MKKSNINLKLKLRVLLKVFFIILIIIMVYFGFIYALSNLSVELSKIVLDYLRVLVWPAIVLIVCYSFHSELEYFLRRVINGKFAGVEFTLAPSQQEKVDETSLQSKLDQVSEENKDDIQAVIDEKEKTITSTKEKVDELQKKVVEKEIELDFERIYNIIFASQIDFLWMIAGQGYISWELANNYFSKFQGANPEVFHSWNFEGYYAFLANSRLINKTGKGYEITMKGRAFLQYLKIMNYQKFGI